MSDEPNADKPGWKRLRDSMLRGTITGVVCGCVTGPVVFVWLLIDSFLEPNAAMGSLIAFGPIMVGMLATALGFCLGPFAGALARLKDVEPANLRGTAGFGVSLMGTVGTLMTSCMYVSNPPNFIREAMLLVGMFLASPIVAGIAGAPLAFKITNRLNY